MLKNWLYKIFLVAFYAVATVGILASGSSSGGGSSGGGDFTCALVVSAIAPATDASGDIWVGVLTKTSEGNANKVVRLDDEGNQIAEFVIGATGTDTIRTLAVDLSVLNNLYVGGDFAGGIVRLEEDATLDPAFAVGTGFDDTVNSIVPSVTLPGRVYVAGRFDDYNGTIVSSLVRLDSSGNRDNGFIAIVSDVESVALADDGSGDVYSGGNSTPEMERWRDNGMVDPPFFTSPITNVTEVTPALDGSGRIYAAANIFGGIIRLFDTGTADAGFVIGTGFNGTISDIVRTADGTNEIYVGGNYSTYDGASANGVVRLNIDGSRDLNFITGSGFETPGDAAAGSEVLSLARATDGTTDLYVGGGFSRYDGSLANGLVRLDADGTRDTAFAVNIDTPDGTCTDDTVLDN